MSDGVGRQLRDDEFRRVRRQSPRAQLLGGEQPGETGAARCGGQLEAEVTDGDGGKSGCGVTVRRGTA